MGGSSAQQSRLRHKEKLDMDRTDNHRPSHRAGQIAKCRQDDLSQTQVRPCQAKLIASLAIFSMHDQGTEPFLL